MLLSSIICQVNGATQAAASSPEAAQVTDAAAQAPQAGGTWMTYGMWGLIILLFVWMFILQPRKQQKKRQEQINKLVKGAKVVTNSGIYGRIKEVKDKAFVITIADGINITVDKSCVYPLGEEDASAFDQGNK